MPLFFPESGSIFKVTYREKFPSQILIFVWVKILILENFWDYNGFPWWQIGHS